jgi:hypothetical protein
MPVVLLPKLPDSSRLLRSVFNVPDDPEEALERDPSDIPALHDWHLEDVLRELGLHEPLLDGAVPCFVCGTKLSIETLGGIIVGAEGAHRLVCSDPACISGAAETRE